MKRRDRTDNKSFLDVANISTTPREKENIFDRTFSRIDANLLVDGKGRSLRKASDSDSSPPKHRGYHTNNRAESPKNYENTNENMNIYNIVGLENPRFDWFMNASMQCIFWAPEFMKFFINKNYNEGIVSRGKVLLNERKSSKTMKMPGHKYCDAVSALCSNVASGDYSTIKASNLRSMFRSEFTKSQQHDANEFIVSLFSKLQDEETPKFAKFDSDKYTDGRVAWNSYIKQHNSIIDELFIGMTQTSIRWGKCKNMSYMYECFNHIHLEWDHPSLQKAYEEYLSDEILKKDQDYKCEKWNKKVKCRIIKNIVKMPKYVLFLFKRFDFVHGRKISKNISYPERILLDDQFESNGKNFILTCLHLNSLLILFY